MKTNDNSCFAESVATYGQPPQDHTDGAINLTPVTAVAAEINRLHEEAKRCSVAAREALHAALTAAWRAGHCQLPALGLTDAL